MLKVVVRGTSGRGTINFTAFFKVWVSLQTWKGEEKPRIYKEARACESWLSSWSSSGPSKWPEVPPAWVCFLASLFGLISSFLLRSVHKEIQWFSCLSLMTSTSNCHQKKEDTNSFFLFETVSLQKLSVPPRVIFWQTNFHEPTETIMALSMQMRTQLQRREIITIVC